MLRPAVALREIVLRRFDHDAVRRRHARREGGGRLILRVRLEQQPIAVLLDQRQLVVAEPSRADRAQLGQVVQRVRDGRLRTNIGNVATLDDAVAALNPTERRKGKTIIRVRP